MSDELDDEQVEAVERAVRSILLGDLDDDGPLRVAVAAIRALEPWMSQPTMRLGHRRPQLPIPQLDQRGPRMKLTAAQREEIRTAVIDMAIPDDDQDQRGIELHADRVVFWLENRDAIKRGDDE